MEGSEILGMQSSEELSSLLVELEDLRNLNKERGLKIKGLEEKLCECHKRISELESFEGMYAALDSEYEALKESFVRLCDENTDLRRMLDAERNRSIWERLFGFG